MGEENYIYHYVNIPGNGTEENIEMINILTPIVNVDEKNSMYNSQIIADTIKYDIIIKTDETHELITNIKTEDNTTDSDSTHDSKRLERLRKDIMRKKLARSRETAEQRTERLNKDRIRKKQARQNETEEQRKRRLEKDRDRIRKRRAQETDEDRKHRLEKNRLSKRMARVKENNTSSSTISSTSSSP